MSSPYDQNAAILSNYSSSYFNATTNIVFNENNFSLEQIAAWCSLASLYVVILLFVFAAHYKWCGINLDTREQQKKAKNIDIRKSQILKELITKMVLSCSTLKLDNTSINNNSQITKEDIQRDDVEIGIIDTDDENSLNSCAICLESFKINDAVSWSRNGKCNHVYHNRCILNWLLKRHDCPYCRCEYITKLEGRHKSNDGCVNDERDSLTFCYSHGLISSSQQQCT